MFEIKVLWGPYYVATFIVTVAISFAFSSNILRLLIIFIHKLNILGKKAVPFYSNIHYI